MEILKVQEVGKRRKNGDQWISILEGVHFTLSKGEMVSICGHSGSGKSTLLGIMCGLDRPTEGQILVKDGSLYDRKESELAQYRNENFGVIFQNFHLIPSLTAVENVEIPLLLGKKRGTRRPEEFLEVVGLGDRKNVKASMLSGGEKQRVAIARALIQNPQVIFADEPTGFLDKENSLLVMKILQKIKEKLGKTIVIATHDQSIAKRADRAIVLKYGKML